ncbi:MAG TPA: type II secretion system F family protein, partial [Phycisphaerae bacterium]|nr:type II secretion system F family protein [Phycisphaerae bacterium]
MASYRYETRDASGQVRSGVLQAASLPEANQLLRAQGGAPLEITALAGGVAGLIQRMQTVSVERGPGLKDVLNFTNQLAVMIKAGIGIREAIGGIAEQVQNPKFKRSLQLIKADVESGHPFSEALARHPKVFSTLYVNMIRAAELSGNLGAMLERISGYLAQQVETRNMVRGAMIYPAIIGVFAVGTVIFLLAWVLPRFTALFAGKESLLPTPTLVLMAASSFLRGYWYVVLGGAVGILVAFLYAIRAPWGKPYWDRIVLRLPLFRKMLRALYISRGMHTMGELVSAGVPMLETLQITADVSGNCVFQEMWRSVHTGVKQGEKIARPLSQQRLLPGNVVQMISAGEESGKLGAVMRDVAEYYAMELKNAIKALTAMIEP